MYSDVQSLTMLPRTLLKTHSTLKHDHTNICHISKKAIFITTIFDINNNIWHVHSSSQLALYCVAEHYLRIHIIMAVLCDHVCFWCSQARFAQLRSADRGYKEPWTSALLALPSDLTVLVHFGSMVTMQVLENPSPVRPKARNSWHGSAM